MASNMQDTEWRNKQNTGKKSMVQVHLVRV